jgi:ABC-type transport system involved in multi-copper enzyme maturation permease subunit
MMRVLFLKEIREAFASRRFWVILALCLVLIPLGVAISMKDYRTRLQNYREAVRIYQAETKTVGDVTGKDGAKAFAPPSPLGFLSLGLELVLPNVAEAQMKYAEPPAVMRFSNSQGRDNLYEFFYGPLDLIFVVAVVMSFLAVILTYGAVAGEKEQGTLKLVLSNPVPRARIILAKTAANGFVLAVPFVLALGLSLAVVEATGGGIGATPGAWTSIGLALLLSLLFIGAFFNLGLLISALTKQAVSALVALLLAWVFLYGVYPRLAAAAAQIAYPVKSEARASLEKAQIRRAIERDRDAEIDKIAKGMPDDFKSAAFKEGEDKQQEIRTAYQGRLQAAWRAYDTDLEARRRTQSGLAANAGRLSPVSCYVRPLAEISRTGWITYERFSAQVGRFAETLNREIFEKQKMVRMKGSALVGSEADDNAAAPVFAYAWPETADIVRNVLLDAVLLIVFNFVFLAGAFVAFLRYDAR